MDFESVKIFELTKSQNSLLNTVKKPRNTHSFCQRGLSFNSNHEMRKRAISLTETRCHVGIKYGCLKYSNGEAEI